MARGVWATSIGMLGVVFVVWKERGRNDVLGKKGRIEYLVVHDTSLCLPMG